MLIKIEELGFTDLLRIDLPELNAGIDDCFRLDLQNDLCNLHVNNLLFFNEKKIDYNCFKINSLNL